MESFQSKPLAEYFRPKSIDDIVGQEHLTGKNGIIRKALEKNIMPNMIFYGPPGVGKTSMANIISQTSNKSMHMLNATYTKTEEVRTILSESKNNSLFKKDILYIDEIQSFNKKQQQILLEFVENGDIILIASTTENPYHYVYKALLSRCMVLEFYNINQDSVKKNLNNTIDRLRNHGFEIEIDPEALDRIVNYSEGDIRRSLNLLELLVQLYAEEKHIKIDKELLDGLNISKQLIYDINGDTHYDILSAFQKSIRGSDPDAAIHYLARLVKSGDLKSICRRLLVIASEDVGLAYPNAITIVKSCVDAALHLGFPEAKIPLAQATVLLSIAPKSDAANKAIGKAMEELEHKYIGDVPNHLKDSHFSGAKDLGRGTQYRFPHDYANHYIKQDYLPKELLGSQYYFPQNNKIEKSFEEALKNIKK